MTSTPISRARAQGAAILAVVFLSGVLAGSAVERWRAPARFTESAPANALVVPTQDVVTNMKLAGTGIPLAYEALGLTDTQRDQIRAIMDAKRPRTDSLLRATWPSLRALLDTVKRQVEQILTPEQRVRLQAMRLGVPTTLTPLPDGRSKK